MSGGGGLIIHLGMSGRLFMLPPGAAVGRHDHVSWWFDAREGPVELRFQDQRRFGLVACRGAGRLANDAVFRHLGPEPLGDAFTADYAFEATRGSRRPVKNTLMDARFVVGVGNIYASEALWLAHTNPKTAARRISRSRWEAIHAAVRAVLRRAVDRGGTTLSDFRSADGNPGYFQVHLEVYGRAGDRCSRCGRTVRRIVQSGRSTFYCSGCQH